MAPGRAAEPRVTFVRVSGMLWTNYKAATTIKLRARRPCLPPASQSQQ